VSRLLSHLTADPVVAPLFIRQVVLIARDLEHAVGNLAPVLGISPSSFRDAGINSIGLHNMVMPVGQGMFLEVVSPLDPKDHNNTGNRQLARRKGDGGYMIMLQTKHLDQERARLEKLGFVVVLDTDKAEMKEIHLHPKDTGRVIVSLSEPRPNAESWCWGGPEWERVADFSKVVRGVRGVVIQADDVNQTATQYAKLFGCRPVRDPDSNTYFFDLCGQQRVTIVPASDGRGTGLAGIDFVARSATTCFASNVAGVRVRVA